MGDIAKMRRFGARFNRNRGRVSVAVNAIVPIGAMGDKIGIMGAGIGAMAICLIHANALSRS